MFDWLPQTEPKRTLSIFGIVALLSVAVILPLSLSGGDEGVRDAIDEAERQTSSSTVVTPVPPSTATTPPPPPPTTSPTPPPTTPGEPPARPPQELRIGQTGPDDRVEFTVKSLRPVKRLAGNSRLGQGPIVARGGRKLIAAEVTFVNRTPEALDPFCGGNSAALYDTDGRPHDTIRNLFEVEGNDAICGGAGTLTGDRATVTLVFELKRTQRPSHLDLWNGKYTPDFDGEASRLRFRP